MLKPSAVEQEFRRRIEQWQGDSEEVSSLASFGFGLGTNKTDFGANKDLGGARLIIKGETLPGPFGFKTNKSMG